MVMMMSDGSGYQCHGHGASQKDKGEGTPSASRPRRKTKNPPSPSSFIRATVDGKTMVLSKFFPLPANASDVTVIPRKEADRAARARIRNGILQAPPPNKPPRRRNKSPPSPPPSPPSPSSFYIRAIVNGETKLLSPYFPLPANATSVEIIPKKRKDDTTTTTTTNNNKKSKVSPQLTAAEKKSDTYKRVDANNTWVPPRSPYNLLQENHYFDPWRVLIICMLLNRTTGRQVREAIRHLFCLCPDAESMAWNADVEEIEEVIRGLGFQKTRARKMKRFSQEYLRDDWTHVTQLHGVGKYAADAYAIFCVGKPEEVIPHDHMLVPYWKFLCNMQEAAEKTLGLQNQHMTKE
ncbi:methyl-CpG-binding domain protein 4 [Dioscorea alata]|uniref:Methyl-CpG-binding domain protein 4 n=1 Tax=Dioscorea alata TaxID=55571 RepID=A0ACB7URM1_DIOAL|nr:methyl-CpG-binding domain protein 4 [Dioscorea alata]